MPTNAPLEALESVVPMWLMIAGTIGLLLAVGVLIGILVHSRRDTQSALAWIALAIFLSVCALPGPVLALLARVGRIGEDQAQMVSYGSWTSVIAGLCSLVLATVYVLQVGRAGRSGGDWDFRTDFAGPDTWGGVGVGNALDVVTELESFEPDSNQQSKPPVAPRHDTVWMRPGSLASNRFLAWLVFLSEPHRGYTAALPDNALVGRDAAKCDVIIDDDSVSGMHARLRFDGQAITLQDVGSRNGTRVNGAEAIKTVLHDHDRIEFGRTELALIWVRDPMQKSLVGGPDEDSGESSTEQSAETEMQAAQDHRPRLALHGKAGDGEVLVLEANTLIGNDAERCDVLIKAEGEPDIHAIVKREGGAFVLYALGHVGARINGEVVSRHMLQDHDRITVGDLDASFLATGQSVQ